MKASERSAYKAVVKERFTVLDAEITQRLGQLRLTIAERIAEEHRDAAKAMDKKAEALWKKSVTLLEAWESLMEEGKEQDLTSQIPMALRQGRPRFTPANLQEKVNKELEQLKQEGGLAKLNLIHEKARLMEQLAMDAVESVDARAFIESLPSVDKLLPAPSEVRQIEV